MPDLLNWLLVFLRITAFLAIFPVFSITNIPVQVRLALGALVAFLVAPVLPPVGLVGADFWKVLGIMSLEVTFGLLLGFVSRLLFSALDIAGAIIGAEIGLNAQAGINPMSGTQSTETASILNYLGALMFLTLNLHHGLLLAFQRSYHFLPVGGGHVRESLLLEIIGRTGQLFWFALQMSAPVMAISFIITLVFAVLSRAVPQMNVFAESFGVRILVGMSVFAMTCQLMAQHVANYLNRLPEDLLTVAHLIGAK